MVKIGPIRSTPKELKEKVFQARRTYNEGKQKLYENCVTLIESKRNPWLAATFFGLLLLIWSIAIFKGTLIKVIWDRYGVFSIPGLFFVAYFAFFLISKLLVKPSADELADDTSYLAVFSACEQRARRGWYSAVFAVLHTGVFLIYLVSQEVGWTNIL